MTLARRATVDDVPELIRLRRLMFESMEHGSGGDDGGWQESCATYLERALRDGRSLAAYVVDAPDGSCLAASGIGTIEERLPAPARPHGRIGHVASMSTDPRWRRHGYARSVLHGLLDWFEAEGASRADLSASEEGLGLYLSEGFLPKNPALRLPLPRH